MTKKKWASFTLRVTITLLLFAFLFKSLSWSTLLAAIARADHVFILLSLPFGALGLLVSAYQWQCLLRGEQIRIGLLKLVKLYLIGTGFSHFLPTGMGGDVVKAFYVGRESDNYAGSASAVVMTRLTGFFGMQLVAFPALIIWHAYFNRGLILWAVLLSLLVGGMIGGVVLLAAVLPGMVKKSWTKNRALASVIPIGNALIRAMKRPRLLASATLIGVVFWILSTLNYYVYAQALRISVPLYFYFVAIPVVSLVAFLPVTINGFGLRESAFVYIFATMHVPATSSLLLALLMDVQVLFFGAIGGLLYLTMRRDERTIKLKKPASNQGQISTASRQTNVVWFTKEEQDVFDSEVLAFDDSTPTLPMLLVEARTAKRGQTTIMRGSGHKEVIGKNKRIKLIKNENDVHVPTIDDIVVPSAMEIEPFQADKFVSRGL
ncbi:MAG TPA: lysylphosphatidylglycerol synthase transmembrane domain-containing protein [Ktedonobacteraceae bacterium]